MILPRFLFIASLLVQPLGAQIADVPQSLLTVGTTAVDSTGAPWAYVRWKANPGTLSYGQPLAISVKNAAPATAGSFTQQGTTELASEPAVVKVQLSRAAALGANAAELAADVSAYFDVVRNGHTALKHGQTLPPASETLEQKLASLVHQARTDGKTAAALISMSNAHPGIALCIGHAWAGRLTSPIGQPVTIEVRPCDPATGQIGGLVARTSFNAGQPEAMLAPGAPVQVPDTTPEGDRVVKLRWATSDPLRRQSPLMRGFHLYRAPRAAAESLGWHTTTPSLAALHAALGNPATLQRPAGTSPIIAGKLFSAATVSVFTGGTADDLTAYYVDDNNRFATNAADQIIGTPHPDGAAFYYFATASDLLGREGAVSPAGLGTACVRIPPRVPDRVTLEEDTPIPIDGTTPVQGLRLTWKANAAIGDNDTDYYEIYRGNDTATPGADFARPETMPAPIATLPHAPNQNGMMSWRDATLPQGGSGDVTWWYSIRAVHASPCPPDNRSRFSPPLFGTVRNYAAPAPPTGQTMIGCPLTGLHIPQLDHGLVDGTFIEPLAAPAAAPSTRRVRLQFIRQDTAVDWVEIKWSWTGHAPLTFDRYEFDTGSNVLTIDSDIPWPFPALVLSGRAGTAAGATSRLVTSAINDAGLETLTETKQLRIECQTGVYALSELRFQNALHRSMFALNSASTTLTGITVSGSVAATAMAGFPDHTPFLIEKGLPVLSGSQFVDAVEVMGGRLVFQEPDYTPALTYTAYRPIVGNTVCMHQADATDGSIRPIRVRLTLPGNVGEYRIYRSVDEATLSLFAQGDGSRLPANAAEVVRDDQTIPANASRVAYFGQTFNRAGIGSALIPLGSFNIARRDVPAPALKRPLASGTPAAPTVRLEWFCPPDGIERFEVRFAPKSNADSSPALPAGGALTLLSTNLRTPVLSSGAASISTFKLIPQTTLTGLVGQAIGAGPSFTLTQPIFADRTRLISVRAISKAGVAGPWSQPHEFKWETPAPPAPPPAEPRVAWPARPLPGTGDWGPLLEAKTFRYVTDTNGDGKIWSPWHAGEYPVGVRIARIGRVIENTLSSALTYYQLLPSGRALMRIWPDRTANRRGYDPANYLLRQGIAANDPEFLGAASAAPSGANSLLPAVLYRQQIPSARYPTVSGDLIQVSPMMEKIAYQFLPPVDTDYRTFVVRDPYIGVISVEPGPNIAVTAHTYIDLYLLDTQPVLKGASYRYTLMRLRADNGEIEEVLNAGDVTIPNNL